MIPTAISTGLMDGSMPLPELNPFSDFDYWVQEYMVDYMEFFSNPKTFHFLMQVL